LARVLITGSSGFVGQNLATFLASRKHQLWSLDRSARRSVPSATVPSASVDSTVRADAREALPQPSPFTASVSWDELDRIPWSKLDAVVHLAGKAHDTKNVSDPQAYFTINAGLTHRLIDRITATSRDASSPIKFVLFSSVKAAADSVSGELTEDVPPNPMTPYGQSKLEAERIVTAAAESHPGLILPYLLRPCMIHGPGNKGNLNLLYSLVRKGIPWPLGAFDNRRSFVSIDNVCHVVEALLDHDTPTHDTPTHDTPTHDTPPGTYNLADDEPISTNRLIGLIAEALGRKPHVWRCPAPLVRAAAMAGDRLRLPLNRERLQKLTESYVVSNRKIKAALGWDRFPLAAEEGISRTLRSFAVPTSPPKRGQDPFQRLS
jgi:nucleoside-diphosphate-sugar epimerase